MFLLSLLFLTVVNGRFSLPVISDPAYHLIPADTLIKSQLSSWGITIGPLSLSLNDGIELGFHLRTTRSSQEEIGSAGEGCSTSPFAIQGSVQNTSRARSNEVDDIDALVSQASRSKEDVRSREVSQTPIQPRRKARRGLRLPLTGEISLNFSASISPKPKQGWGEAENVARGERGDTEWFTYITVGSPPQSLPILPDTGSSDMFVYTKQCDTCYTSNHTSFDPPSSATFRNSSALFRLDYADGSGATGYVGQDTVSFGADDIVSTKMVFGLATQAHGRTFRDSGRSGILGMGQDGMTTIPGGSTLLTRIMNTGQISEKVMSIRLEKGVSQKGVMQQEGGGSYLLGGIEEQYIRGGRTGLSWIKTSSNNYWGFALEDISLGLASTMFGDTETPRRAIIDSGTSLIITSDQVARSIHSFIPRSFAAKSGVWYIPCNTSFPTTPNLFFQISGRRYAVPIEDLAWKASESFPDMCISGVQGGMPYFTVLGDLFIKNHYVVLSYGKGKDPQVGLGDRSDVPLVL